MSNRIIELKFISDNDGLVSVIVSTTDSGIEILTTFQNQYTGKFTTYTGSGIKSITGIRLQAPFFDPAKSLISE